MLKDAMKLLFSLLRGLGDNTLRQLLEIAAALTHLPIQLRKSRRAHRQINAVLGDCRQYACST